MTALLDVSNVVKRFAVGDRTLTALDGFSLQIAPGEAVGLVGESGCGKSTLARTIIGLDQADGGSIKLQGTELVGLSHRGWLPHRRDVQMIFQDPFASLNPRLTIGRIIEEPLLVHRVGDAASRRERSAELMTRVGLSPDWRDRFPHEFSGGQRQRIGIARALALSPRLLICDEPVSALDVSVQAQVQNLLADLREELGLAYLFISHDLAVVAHLCTRIFVMYLGQVVEIGDRHTLHAAPRHPYTQALVAASPIPDPDRAAEFGNEVLGDIPSQLDVPSGCRFHPRCPRATERCRVEAPLLRQLDARAWASCHYADVPVSCPEDGRMSTAPVRTELARTAVHGTKVFR
ncbi:Oligopeptide transport ATP-binding protein OppF [Xylophilus ampelinus]|nr:Oligopeptide transport ATP-binding protein OppF [Xylophilus ampelinus]